MKVFITGITGTLGHRVTQNLLVRGDLVIGLSRDEQKQRAMGHHPGLTLYLGDVRDRDRLQEATRGVDMILHFAALKCVDTLEENPEESIATNVFGTENVLYAQRVNGIPRVVLASTDKAVYPVNTYGASKMLAERLVLRNPNNVVCRYGNVLGSRGSVLPMFVKTLTSEDSHANVTDKRMTRFWTTVDRAASFVLSCAFDGEGGLRVPEIDAAPILSVVDAVADHLGVKAFEVNEVGIRAGEKLHECLLTAEENEGRPLYSNEAEMDEAELAILVSEAMRGLK